MQQPHRRDRDSWREEEGGVKGERDAGDAKAGKTTLVTKFTSFTTLPSNSPISPGCAQIKTICEVI